MATRGQRLLPASAIRAGNRPLDPFRCSGEASFITAREAAGRRRLICWPGCCLDELTNRLADDPRDRSVSGQRNLIERPIVLLFQAHGQPRCLARTLVHATPLRSCGSIPTRASDCNGVMHFSPAVELPTLGVGWIGQAFEIGSINTRRDRGASRLIVSENLRPVRFALQDVRHPAGLERAILLRRRSGSLSRKYRMRGSTKWNRHIKMRFHPQTTPRQANGQRHRRVLLPPASPLLSGGPSGVLSCA